MLFLIMFVIFMISILFPFFEQDDQYDLNTFKKEAARFRASSVLRADSIRKFNDYSNDKARKVDYFEFDPNGLSKEQWLRLGLSQKQIAVIHNYEAKGGRFYKKEDLGKIYSVTPRQYKQLERYIRIPEPGLGHRVVSARPNLKIGSNSDRVKETQIELNSADSLKLESVSGIGPVLASRILRFRNRLGGFHSLTQLREVYGIDSLKFERLKGKFIINSELIQKIDLNRAAFDDLRHHPYLNYKQMNAIIQFRKQHGSFKSIDDLKKIVILNEEIIRKIEPYIVLNP